MTDEKLIGLIKQGAETWNEAVSKGILPKNFNFNGVILRGINLKKANLHKVHLREADFFGANLSESDLSRADLRKALLRGVDLSRSNLQNAYLMEAQLESSKLNEGNLQNAHLRKADLKRTDFTDADLTNADLIETDLREAVFYRAILNSTHFRNADIQKADFREANLIKATFQKANLRKVDFRKAKLNEADLRETDLVETDFRNANITGVRLYGTSRDDWLIDGIECDYIFWDSEGKTRTPKDRFFKRGEFEELYKHLPTFEYFFENGITLIDIAIINQVINEIREQHPEWDLKIDGFHSRGQANAKFTILDKDLIITAFNQIRNGYETALNRLKDKYDEANRLLLKFIQELTSKPQVIITGGIFMNTQKQIIGDDIKIESGGGNIAFGKDQATVNMPIYGSQVQQWLKTITPQSSSEEIVKFLTFVQQELPKLSLPDSVKKEVVNEIEGAKIQAEKTPPEKKKLVERLSNAVVSLKEMGNLGKEAVMIGNLIGKAIEWGGEKWIEWIV